MRTSDGAVIPIDELRAILHSARIAPKYPYYPFIRRLRSFAATTRKDNPYARTLVFLPYARSSNVAIVEQIMDTPSWKIKSDYKHDPARDIILPRLRLVLSTYKAIRRLRTSPGPCHRAEVKRLTKRLASYVASARSTLIRIEDSTLDWHARHQREDRW